MDLVISPAGLVVGAVWVPAVARLILQRRTVWAGVSIGLVVLGLIGSSTLLALGLLVGVCGWFSVAGGAALALASVAAFTLVCRIDRGRWRLEPAVGVADPPSGRAP